MSLITGYEEPLPAKLLLHSQPLSGAVNPAGPRG